MSEQFNQTAELPNLTMTNSSPHEGVELTPLVHEIQIADGFKLLFIFSIKSHSYQSFVANLRRELPQINIQAIHLEEPVTSLLDELHQQLEQPIPDAVFVSGLEHSVPRSVDTYTSPFVQNLEATHNLFPQRLPCPLVLWMPYYVLNAIRYGAPHFFHIRSRIDSVTTLPRDILEQVIALSRRADSSVENTGVLTEAQRQKRINAIQKVLADYESLPHDKRDPILEIGNLHSQLGNLLFAQGAYHTAQGHFEEALALAKDHLHREAEGIATLNLGNAYQSLAELEKAEAAYLQGLEIARELGNCVQESDNLHNLADLYRSLKKWSEAEQSCLQAFNILKELGDHQRQANILNVLGNIRLEQQRWHEAEEAYQQALTLSREAHDLPREAAELSNLGSLYLKQGRLEEAEQYLLQALKQSQDLGYYVAQAQGLHNLSLLRWMQGNIIEAMQFAHDRVAILEKTEALPELELARLSLTDLTAWATLQDGGNLVEEGAWQHGLERLRVALELFRAVDDALGKASTFYWMGIAHLNFGDYELALMSFKDADRHWRRVGNEDLAAQARLQIGKVELQLQRFGSAIDHLRSASAYFHAHGDDNLAAASDQYLELAQGAQATSL